MASNHSHERKQARILVLDRGWPYGAAAGLLKLYLLRRVMYHIQPSDDFYSLMKPCDWFDLIVGRGIGGFLALLLGRQRLGVQDCIDRYKEVLKPFLEEEMKYAPDPKQELSPLLRESDRTSTTIAEFWVDQEARLEEMIGKFCSKEDPLEEPFRKEGETQCRTLVVSHPLQARLYSDSPRDLRTKVSEQQVYLRSHSNNVERRWCSTTMAAMMHCISPYISFPPPHYRIDPVQTLSPLLNHALNECNLLLSDRSITAVEINPLFGGEENHFEDWYRDTRGIQLYSMTSKNETKEELRLKLHNLDHLLSNSKISAAMISGRFSSYFNLVFDCRSLLSSRLRRSSIATLSRRFLNNPIIHDSVWNWAYRVSSNRASMLLSSDHCKSSSPLKLLSFDGGGVRGLSSLLILQELMESVRKSQGLEVAPLPCEYFDMIAGTSTGGLIAILLGRLRMSVSDCIELYKKFGQEIFEKELGWTTSTRFSSAVLQSVLEKIITNHIGHEEVFLRDPMVANGGGCPVFVVAIDRERIAEPEGAVLLRTYDREDPNQPLNLKYCFLWQAALATCAAPIFFSPVQVGSQFLVDGGLGHNNPTEHLIEEAELQWPERPISAVISIGTGLKKSSELAKDLTRAASGSRFRSMYHMALVLKHIALSSEHIERSVRSLFKGRHNLDSYFRFNVSEGMDIELYEYQKYPQIQQSTRSYLDQKEVQDRMQVCAETLECIIAGEKRQRDSGSGVYEKLAPSPLTPPPSSDHMDLTESFRESLALKGQQRNLEQTWQFLEDPAIELYVMDHLITDECVTVLAYDSKLPERLHLSTAQLPDDRRNHPANPKGYLAYFLSSKLPKSFTAEQRRLSILNLQMSEEACRIDMSPGAWQLSWLVLIDRRRIVSHSPDEGGILDAERNIINSMAIDDEEEANSQSSCGPLVTFSAESLNNDQEIHRVALEVEMILGVDIAEGPFWQEIVLDEFMVVQAQKPVLQFVVTCKDRTWFEEEKRDEWIIYVGGVRLTPVPEKSNQFMLLL